MKILVNNKETELTQGNTLADVACQLELPAQGVAIALNNRMIPRAQWAEQAVKTETVWSSLKQPVEDKSWNYNSSPITLTAIPTSIRPAWLSEAVAAGSSCA